MSTHAHNELVEYILLLDLCHLAGAGKDVPIVTPLMDFVRQKRASKGPRVFCL